MAHEFSFCLIVWSETIINLNDWSDKFAIRLLRVVVERPPNTTVSTFSEPLSVIALPLNPQHGCIRV